MRFPFPLPKIVLAVLLLLSLVTMILFMVVETTQHHDTHAHHVSMIDCPFMGHEETLCPMTIIEHIGAIRQILEMTVPHILFLIAACGYVLLSFHISYLYALRMRVLIRTVRIWRTRVLYTFAYKWLGDLFSYGILHTKIFTYQ